LHQRIGKETQGRAELLLQEQGLHGIAIEVGEAGGVAESLGERIRVDLQFGDQLVLVGRHRRENCLWEHVGLVVQVLQFLGIRRNALAMAKTHQVDPGLVAVHRVQNDLEGEKRKGRVAL